MLKWSTNTLSVGRSNRFTLVVVQKSSLNSVCVRVFQFVLFDFVLFGVLGMFVRLFVCLFVSLFVCFFLYVLTVLYCSLCFSWFGPGFFKGGGRLLGGGGVG